MEQLLHELQLFTIQQVMDIQSYAGGAFFDDKEEDMNWWKGQHFAYETVRKHMAELELRIAVELYDAEEAETYAEHVKKQMATLTDGDHELFEAMVQGLLCLGWIEEGGSPTFRLLHKGGAAIKVFRNEEAPKVIKTCWTAPPEVEPDQKELNRRRSQI